MTTRSRDDDSARGERRIRTRTIMSRQSLSLSLSLTLHMLPRLFQARASLFQSTHRSERVSEEEGLRCGRCGAGAAAAGAAGAAVVEAACANRSTPPGARAHALSVSVSYTHLTLPTICSV
eukprot:101164-Rhodomonas_salina.1